MAAMIHTISLSFKFQVYFFGLLLRRSLVRLPLIGCWDLLARGNPLVVPLALVLACREFPLTFDATLLFCVDRILVLCSIHTDIVKATFIFVDGVMISPEGWGDTSSSEFEVVGVVIMTYNYTDVPNLAFHKI